ncbi:MAG: Dihydrodipicolinate synthase [Candidatus Curtissbacteria bacterium GW2011_GWA1_40_16]|uniref:4-hydroxy-tetrahydrodipicolinate synthase n=1 Tax=Candidatus Curtissbacteria bacterium GW2011_GWA1_40_16 TaxID=1618405 RepID=A0A0G0RDH8_9BACT|nr:MAG: Dihydrodipicolinate synthase [Candidatus Curtissbacteria bacterium GW2011_GWA1_40_16]
MKEADQFGRLHTAMVSPFGRNGELNVEQAERLATHLVDTGTTTVVVTGTTGESPTLTERERRILINAAQKGVGGRAKVIAGTGTNSTAQSIDLSRQAQAEGAQGLLLVTPYYNKPTQEGLFRHFAAIAEAVDLPLILYNVPSRTGVNLEARTVERLDREYGNIVGDKEAVGLKTEVKNGEDKITGEVQIALILENRTEGFEIWSGNDQDTLPMMRQGAYGVVSVASHLTGDLISRMINHHVVGEDEQAQQLHDRLMPLFEALFPPTSPEPSPASVKAMLNITGMEVGGLRLPLVEVPDSYKARLQVLLAEYDLTNGP